MTSYIEISNYINGTHLAGSGEGETVILNPADGSELGRFRHSSEADIDAAVSAACEAFKTWSRTSAWERAEILKRVAAEIRGQFERLAELMTLENGKPIAEARAEWAFTANLFEWYAEETVRNYGRNFDLRVNGMTARVAYEPIGPVACFSTWNFPAVTPHRKAAAAMAAGCTVVIKPADEAPGCTNVLVECLEAAGLPKGVFNIVVGEPAMISSRLIAAREIRKISLTGSVQVGKLLARQAADSLKKVTLELGGHAPVIIHSDVDPQETAVKCVLGKYRNGGQICTSPTRFYVHKDVYSAFETKFVEEAEAIKLGNGLDPSIQMGPLATDRRLCAVDDLVSDARRCGAKVLTGGERVGNVGNYYRPTVLVDVPDNARVLSEEPFGPIAILKPWSDYDETIAAANELDLGLAAYVFSTNRKLIDSTIRDLKVGAVGVNNFSAAMPEVPFGGVKESGYGLEGGMEGLREYQVTKSVTLAY